MKWMTIVLAAAIACGSYVSGAASSSGGSAASGPGGVATSPKTYRGVNVAAEMLKRLFDVPSAKEFFSGIYESGLPRELDEELVEAARAMYGDLFADMEDVNIPSIKGGYEEVDKTILLREAINTLDFRSLAMGVYLYIRRNDKGQPTPISAKLNDAIAEKWSDNGPNFNAKANQVLWIGRIGRLLSYARSYWVGTGLNYARDVEPAIRFLAGLVGREFTGQLSEVNALIDGYALRKQIAQKLTENPENITKLRTMLTDIADKFEAGDRPDDAKMAPVAGSPLRAARFLRTSLQSALERSGGAAASSSSATPGIASESGAASSSGRPAATSSGSAGPSETRFFDPNHTGDVITQQDRDNEGRLATIFPRRTEVQPPSSGASSSPGRPAATPSGSAGPSETRFFDPNHTGDVITQQDRQNEGRRAGF